MPAFHLVQVAILLPGQRQDIAGQQTPFMLWIDSDCDWCVWGHACTASGLWGSERARPLSL